MGRPLNLIRAAAILDNTIDEFEEEELDAAILVGAQACWLLAELSGNSDDYVSTEYETFAAAMKRILTVSKQELLDRMDQYDLLKQARPKKGQVA